MRFAQSSSALQLPSLDLDAWQDLISHALEAWDVPGEAVLKLLRTRGPEHWASAPTEILTISPAPDSTKARSGIRAITLNRGYAADAFAEAPWLLGGVKTLSYGINVAAKREATRRGVDEAIFVSADGYLLEAPTAGLIIATDGQLWTTPTAGTGILRSITVEVIMEEASARGIDAQESLFTPADLAGIDGLWTASAIRGVLPVLSVDGVPIPHDPALTAELAASAGF